MSKHAEIKKILITAGTHGNEMSGIEYLRNLQNNTQTLSLLAPKECDIDIEFTLVNKPAIERRTRYVEEDLNRQFSEDKLSKLTGSSLEHQLAIDFNAVYGPKQEPTRDLVIDIHNTTSNMGPTLIIFETDEFHQQMARYLKRNMPEVVILIEDHIAYKQHPYLCTIGKKGLMIEVGPQAHGVLRPAVYLQTQAMTQLIIGFCEIWNNNAANIAERVDAYRLTKEVPFPLNTNNSKSAMIHPDIENQDFVTLNAGQPVFLSFEGQTINWDGESDVYPHFIGEAAYYHLDIAFALAKKTCI